MDQSTGSMVQLVITTVVIVIAFYFILIRPQSKKQKEEEDMRKNLEIGDEIITIGGIVGRVVSINDDTESMVIETGADRTKIRLKKWALSSVNTEKNNKASDKKDSKDKKEKEKKNEKKK